MIYLIANNSYHIIDEEINKIVKGKPYESLDFLKTDLQEILEEANYTSLFDDEKILIIKNSIFFATKKDVDTKILEKYLEHPNEKTTLIFTYNGSVDERKKITKIIKDKFHCTIIKPLYQKDIVARLMKIALSNKFVLKSPDANLISQCSLNNYDIAYNELEKIMLYYNKPCEIEHDVVSNLLSISMEDNNFKFVDAVINKDTKSAMKILNDFKLSKVEPIILLNLLAREFRLMLLVRELKTNKQVEKYDTVLHLQGWQIDKLLKEGYLYTNEELENELMNLCNIDYQIKKGSINKYLALEMYILKE